MGCRVRKGRVKINPNSLTDNKGQPSISVPSYLDLEGLKIIENFDFIFEDVFRTFGPNTLWFFSFERKKNSK